MKSFLQVVSYKIKVNNNMIEKQQAIVKVLENKKDSLEKDLNNLFKNLYKENFVHLELENFNDSYISAYKRIIIYDDILRKYIFREYAKPEYKIRNVLNPDLTLKIAVIGNTSSVSNHRDNIRYRMENYYYIDRTEILNTNMRFLSEMLDVVDPKNTSLRYSLIFLEDVSIADILKIQEKCIKLSHILECFILAKDVYYKIMNEPGEISLRKVTLL